MTAPSIAVYVTRIRRRYRLAENNRPDNDGGRRVSAQQQQALWHGFADMGVVARDGEFVISRGDGADVWDADGRRYVDATAGLWFTNIGHGRQEVADAVAAQLGRIAAYSTFGDYAVDTTVALADRLAAIAPVPGSKIFFTSGGSDSVDSAVKLARRYWRETGHDTQEDRHRPGKGLPRHACGRHRTGRHPRQSRRLRRADGRRPHRCLGHRQGTAGAHRGTRRRSDRGLLLRAGDRGRRHLSPAGRLSGRGPTDLPGQRHPVRRRRGDHRIRPDRW